MDDMSDHDDWAGVAGPATASESPPDVMNDPAFEPPPRRDTASSKATSGEWGGETCRICRSEGSPDEPLFYPCKCSGSIKFVHQECLMEWLAHSHKKHCELCKTPFRFTKLYDANMPSKLPWTVFVRTAFIHTALAVLRACRAVVVGFVWLIVLPYIIRWTWRWMFWAADAGWAREAYMRKVQEAILEQQAQSQAQLVRNATSSTTDTLMATIEQLFGGSLGLTNGGTKTTQSVSAMGMIGDAISSALRNVTNMADTYHVYNTTTHTTQANPSILSSWSYLSELTPSTVINRIILDVFEGQLITCVVITGFILVFLIREWVVQQQPLVNIDNMNHQQRERERQERERELERLQRQAELLQQARLRLIDLQNDARQQVGNEEAVEPAEFVGWDQIYDQIDSATDELRENGSGRERFYPKAAEVMRHVLSAERTGINASELADGVFQKLKDLPSEQRDEWEEVMVDELKKQGVGKRKIPRASPPETSEQNLDVPSAEATASSGVRRPPMPTRDGSSRAAHIQRILEEADGVLAANGRHNAIPTPPASTVAEPPTGSASVVSAPSSTDGSWQAISPPDEQKLHDTVVDHTDIFQDNNDEIPITNAGPDAKINIKRSGKGKGRAVVPEPEEITKPLSTVSNEELQRRLLATSPTSSSGDILRLEDRSDETLITANPEPAGPQTNNPFQPDRPEPSPREFGSPSERPALEEDSQLENLLPLAEASPAPSGESNPMIENTGDSAAAQVPNAVQPGLWQRLADWFWGDIQAPGAQEPALAPMEERLGEGEDAPEAPFVPAQNDDAVIDDELHGEDQNENDPEVVAAAQQAGLDAEALEDAEDLEGIFELIGLQGPLIGLFQTSCFCSVLVTGTVWAAVGVPYVWGKVVLSFLGAPVSYLIKGPLQTASFVTDILVDLVLMISGWFIFSVASFLHSLGLLLEICIPALAESNLSRWISGLALSTASTAGGRLQDVFSFDGEPLQDAGWNNMFLRFSVHSHASLKTIEHEVNTVLDYIGDTITTIVETISSGSVSVVWEQTINACLHVTAIPTRVISGIQALEQYTRPFIAALNSLRTGSLTFPSSAKQVDPSLVYWSSSDRGLAVFTGYLALAAVAAVYVALDRPITNTQSGQKIEKKVRDNLRQAGGVLKVILIISIEMLIFPLYCGLLLDLAFLPLWQDASVATRWAFAVRAPNTFCFIHWFVGTCYMFHFALFVGMCRKILRKGVLWFIRDPDDPTFHPVRDVLERNVTTQLRKIAFSALVYGALVILCLGGVIWGIGKAFHDIFPVHWISTEPTLEFPTDLLVYTSLTPVLFKRLRPSNAVNTMYAWWLRRCARVLRLSHFMFDDRRKDEEGRHVRKSWSSFFLMRRANLEAATVPAEQQTNGETPEVYFKRDGKYVLTPCNDQYRPPKPGEAFLQIDEDDVYITDKEGNKNDHFGKVYVPPFFRLRVMAFMVCLWMFSAFMGLCVTLVPLCFGRQVLKGLLPHGVMVSDIYPYSIGVYVLGSVVFALLKGGSGLQYVREKAMAVDIKAWAIIAQQYLVRTAKCLYVYGFLGVVLPLVFALLLQFYFILPLHTYLVATLAPALQDAANNGTNSTVTNALNATISTFSTSGNQTEPLTNLTPTLADHTIHILSDYALGILYLRIALRAVISTPTSRAAEAIRRVTADGYFNPDAKLATRFFILPTTLFALLLLTAPIGLAKSITTTANWVGIEVAEALETVIVRYSYPVSAGWVMLILGGMETMKATGRWRARIRDEVYLVGERLHNFGEKRPPVGSKSVVRKDRPS